MSARPTDEPRRRAVFAVAAAVLLVLAVLAAILAVGAARQRLNAPTTPMLTSAVDADWQLARGREAAAAGRVEAAREAFERAIELRPRSPDGHLGLAELWLSNGDASDDAAGLAAAFAALAVGPNEGRVFTTLWPHWLFRWAELEPDARAQVLDLVDRQVGRFPDWTIEVAARYGRHFEICDRLSVRARAERACRRAGWTAPMDTENNETGSTDP